MDASNMLKPVLARGELQCIGATTLDEYREHIEKDAALERRFQPILVGEPTVEETIAILEGLRDKYEEHHKVKITDEALVAAAHLSDRYISRPLPARQGDRPDRRGGQQAAHRVDDAAARPARDGDARCSELAREGAAAVQAQDYERAAQLKRADRQDPERPSSQAKDAWLADKGIADATVDADDIAEIVSRWTGIPVQRMIAGGGRQAAAHGGAAARARDRPGRGGRRRVGGRAPRARRPQGPAPAHRLVHLPRARPAWARPSWPRPWPSSSSTTRTPWSAST